MNSRSLAECWSKTENWLRNEKRESARGEGGGATTSSYIVMLVGPCCKKPLGHLLMKEKL